MRSDTEDIEENLTANDFLKFWGQRESISSIDRTIFNQLTVEAFL